MSILNEFKDFIKRGNVIDLAIGVVIGTAFANIVTSLVNCIILPIIDVFLGIVGLELSEIAINFDSGATIYIGMFIQSIINFILIAAAIFLCIKFVQQIMHKPESNKEEIVKSNEEKLLEEIRDLLKKKNKEEK